MTRLRLTILLALVACAASTVAYGYFTATSTPGASNPAAKADTLPAGLAPSVAISGQSVTVSITQRSVGGKQLGEYAGGGYRIRRYAGGATPDGTGATPLTNCNTTVAGAAATLTCTENNVPAGSWKYTATPVLNSWTGNESAASNVVSYTADTTAPVLQSLEMLDFSGNGKVDRVVATFDEDLALSTDAAPWTLANIPGGSTKGTVSTSGKVATLLISENAAAVPNTAVGSFTVALSATSTGIRDAAGNAASFAARAPSDKAAPFLVPMACPSAGNRVTFDGQTSESGGTVSVAVTVNSSGAAFATVTATPTGTTSPFTWKTDPLAVGNKVGYVGRARHTDAAGNVGNQVTCTFTG